MRWLPPGTADEWSLAWDGREGFVRTGAFAGTTTDCGDAATRPRSLRMMLDEAKTRGDALGRILGLGDGAGGGWRQPAAGARALAAAPGNAGEAEAGRLDRRRSPGGARRGAGRGLGAARKR